MSRRWNIKRFSMRRAALGARNPELAAQNRLSVEDDRLSWVRDDRKRPLTLLESTMFPAAIFVLLCLPFVLIFGVIALVQLLHGSFKGFGDDPLFIAFIFGFNALLALAFWGFSLMVTQSERFSFDASTGTLSLWTVRIARRPVETLVPFEAIVALYPLFSTTYAEEGTYRVRFTNGTQTQEETLGIDLSSEDLERMSAWLRPVFGARVGAAVRLDS